MIAAIPMVNAAFAVKTFLDGTRIDEARIFEMMGTGEFLVAVEVNSDRIVACVYTEKRGQRGFFGMLAVERSRQGTGLGRKMVEAAEEYCRNKGCTVMDIKVLSLRPELLPLYHKLGYVEAGTDEFRPSPGGRVTWRAMRKNLTARQDRVAVQVELYWGEAGGCVAHHLFSLIACIAQGWTASSYGEPKHFPRNDSSPLSRTVHICACNRPRAQSPFGFKKRDLEPRRPIPATNY